MHVGDAAELALQRRRQNDDRDLGTFAAQRLGNVGPEFACAQVVIENGNIDTVQLGFSLFDGAGGHYLVALLPKYGRAQHQVVFAIVQQQHADGSDGHGLRTGRLRQLPELEMSSLIA